VTDDGLPNPAASRAKRKIDLYGTQVVDAGMAHLKRAWPAVVRGVCVRPRRGVGEAGGLAELEGSSPAGLTELKR